MFIVSGIARDSVAAHTVNMAFTIEYIRGIILVYDPVTRGIFKYLRPMEVSSLCSALGIRLDNGSKQRFINPLAEVYRTIPRNDTVILTGDNIKELIDYNGLHRSVHIHYVYPPSTKISPVVNTIIVEDISSSYISTTDFIMLSISYANLSSKESCVAKITHSYRGFSDAARRRAPYMKYDAPCVVCRQGKWYDDVIEITMEAGIPRARYSIKLRGSPSLLNMIAEM